MAAKHPSSSSPPDEVDAAEGDFMFAVAACAARTATRAAVCRPALPPRAPLAAAHAALRTEQNRAEQNRSASPATVRARMLRRALAGTHLARLTAEPGWASPEGVGGAGREGVRGIERVRGVEGERVGGMRGVEVFRSPSKQVAFEGAYR